jgi:hypothetical protein
MVAYLVGMAIRTLRYQNFAPREIPYEFAHGPRLRFYPSSARWLLTKEYDSDGLSDYASATAAGHMIPVSWAGTSSQSRGGAIGSRARARTFPDVATR